MFKSWLKWTLMIFVGLVLLASVYVGLVYVLSILPTIWALILILFIASAFAGAMMIWMGLD